MFPGPVFIHELRRVARRRRFYLMRLIFGLFLVYMTATYAQNRWLYGRTWEDQSEYSFRELATIGARLFSNVTWLQAMAVLMLTPALVAGAIGEDRERKILSYLLASPLTAAEIVLGKLAARLANLTILIAVGLPVVSIALFLGGVEPDGVWLAFGATLSSLFFLAAISIFVSTFSNRPRDAILLTYAIEACWLMVPVVELGIVQSGGVVGQWFAATRPVTDFLSASSPTHLLFRNRFGPGSAPSGEIFWMIGLQLLYGTILIAWSTLRLRAIEQGSSLLGLRLPVVAPSGKERRLRHRRPCGDDPMLWKECPETFSSGGWKRAGVSTVIALGFLAGVLYWIFDSAAPALWEMTTYGYGSTTPNSNREMMNNGVRTFTACLYSIMVLFLGVTAATTFTSEKEKDTWISLVATPLEGWEILRGKILGAFWQVRWSLAALLLIWLIGLVCGAVHPLGVFVAATATAVYAFWAATLGAYVSLRSESSVRAIATTLGIGMFCNFGYLFCCIPIIWGPGSMVGLAGVTPLIVTGAVCSFAEFDGFMNWLNHGRDAEVIFLWMISVVFYGLAGFALLRYCLDRFEIVVDRPQRGWWSRGESAPAGIAFLEDEIPRGKRMPSVEEVDESGEGGPESEVRDI